MITPNSDADTDTEGTKTGCLEEQKVEAYRPGMTVEEWKKATPEQRSPGRANIDTREMGDYKGH